MRNSIRRGAFCRRIHRCVLSLQGGGPIKEVHISIAGVIHQVSLFMRKLDGMACQPTRSTPYPPPHQLTQQSVPLTQQRAPLTQGVDAKSGVLTRGPSHPLCQRNCSLCMAERTGCPVFCSLWSYVTVEARSKVYEEMRQGYMQVNKL